MHFPVSQFFLAAALSAAACSAAAAGDAAPQRKAGLWEITAVAPVSVMTTRKVCVGENDETDCTEPELTPLNERIIVTVECTNKDGKQIISSTFTGDFETRYHGTMKTTFDPPIGAMRRMGVNIDGKYLGPDCPDEAGAACQ